MDPDAIRLSLGRLALAHGVKVLYACESGSRAWGFASADSDYDARFLYVRPTRDYLRLTRPRDVIETMEQTDFDLVGWDVFKACRLLRKSNCALSEWLRSPIVYVQEEPFVEGMRAAASRWFSRRACCEHYLSMARGNYRRYVQGREEVSRKKYLYVLRPLACVRWIAEGGALPPVLFEEVMHGTAMPDQIRQAIAQLLADKQRDRDMGIGPMIPELNEYVDRSLTELAAAARRMPDRRFPEEPLNDLIASVLLA